MFKPLAFGKVILLPGLLRQRYDLNRRYMLSLKTENLLQNYYLEAGLWAPRAEPGADIHWGWEAPTCQLRGHFLGHWLSAAAYITANTGDHEIHGKANYIISELARCQVENGGEWAGSIPEKYLDWAARGKPVWAPHYTLHKTLMGLWDMYAVGGNQQALEILVKWAHWFSRWSSQFSREQMNDILDVETGGMLEVWANLYGATGEKEHLDLIERYDRQRLFEPLRAGKDVLTNMHMNTTIPEVQGAARAYEVTGAARWREIVEAYWRMGVTERGVFATGGQSNGEVWTPSGELSSRLGFRTQEHCTVYNMMRLAEYQLRWTGDPLFADYWERNLWNGILAQQHPDSGMIAYFLPFYSGAQKVWGSPTEDFWCCHGSLVQAHTNYTNNIAYETGAGLALAQLLPSEISWEKDGAPVSMRIEEDHQIQFTRRPDSLAYTIQVQSAAGSEFDLQLRLPWWLSGAPVVEINGEAQAVGCAPSTFISLKRAWKNDTIHVVFPKELVSVPLPDDPHTVAFMDGPIVLAGLNPGAIPTAAMTRQAGHYSASPNYAIDGLSLQGDPANPRSFLIPDNEREWTYWRGDFRSTGQPKNIRFVPLYEVRDEVYTVYFEM